MIDMSNKNFTLNTSRQKPVIVDANEFLGMSKKTAQDYAEARNLIFRLLSIDGEPFFSLPEDTRTDRVCVDIVDGKIVKASIQ
jgi:hypothetical protein